MAYDTLDRRSLLREGFDKVKASFLKFKLIEVRDEEEDTEKPRPRREQSALAQRQKNDGRPRPRQDRSYSVYEAAYRKQREPQRTPDRKGALVKKEPHKGKLPVAVADYSIFYVQSLQGCTLPIRALMAGSVVTVYFENTDRALTQRIIDTLSGAAFALNAIIRKIADNTYVLAPEGADVKMVYPSERRY